MKYKSEPYFILLSGILTFTWLVLYLTYHLIFVHKNLAFSFIILFILIIIIRYLVKNLIKEITLDDTYLIIDFLLKKKVNINYNEISKVVINQEGFLPYHVYHIKLKSKKHKRLTIYCKNKNEEKEMIEFFKSKGVFVRNWIN